MSSGPGGGQPDGRDGPEDGRGGRRHDAPHGTPNDARQGAQWSVQQGAPHPGKRRRPRYRALSPLREHLREAFWFAPLLTCVGAVLLAGLTDLLDREIFAEASAAQTADTLLSFSSAAKSVVSTV